MLYNWHVIVVVITIILIIHIIIITFYVLAFGNIILVDFVISRNVLFAPSSHDAFSRSTFTGIRDAFDNYQSAISSQKSDVESLWEVVKKQISIATLAVQSASSLISDESFP